MVGERESCGGSRKLRDLAVGLFAFGFGLVMAAERVSVDPLTALVKATSVEWCRIFQGFGLGLMVYWVMLSLRGRLPSLARHDPGEE